MTSFCTAIRSVPGTQSIRGFVSLLPHLQTMHVSYYYSCFTYEETMAHADSLLNIIGAERLPLWKQYTELEPKLDFNLAKLSLPFIFENKLLNFNLLSIKMYSLSACSPMSFDKHKHLCNYHHSEGLTFFHPPPKPCDSWQLTPYSHLWFHTTTDFFFCH